MVMTILEGRVAQDDWPALEAAYHEASQADEPGLVSSYLVHNSRETDQWRILTLWESRQALAAMRASGETPRGVLIFRLAHSEPMLSVFDVVQTIPGA